MESSLTQTWEYEALTPRTEYNRLLRERRQAVAHWNQREERAGAGRVAVFLLALVLAWVVFGLGYLGKVWLLAPAAAFLALLAWHNAIRNRRTLAERAVAYYERGLARVNDKWQGTGQPGERYRDEKHPYAADLDLFGPGSLFELLCTAKTRTGEDTLAAWLRGPATPLEIKLRQEAVAELSNRLDLRERLALLGAQVPEGADLQGLVGWGVAAPAFRPGPLQVVAQVLVALVLLAVLGWVLWDTGPIPLAVAVALEAAFAYWLRHRVRRVLAPVERRAGELALFADLLALLEQQPFTAPRLKQLQQSLDARGRPPSRRIAALFRWLDLLNARNNQFFAPLAPFLLWTTQMALAIEAWRLTSGPAVPRWLQAVGEAEALGALGTYAYEHPDDPYPEIVPEGPVLQAEGVAHPLLPPGKGVRNDVTLDRNRRVWIISGSNMSGKSTLLRTVGVNAVLALAGAPVRARRLRVSPLVVGSTLRIQDSLQAGQSRFYAEITRLRRLVDLSRGPLPLLFLLDELLHGTNSHDRKIGAEAVVRGLVRQGAVGLLTTHDLSLTGIASLLSPVAENAHFADHFENGEMRFDYKLRPGVVQHSNALALMRSVGLDV